MSENFDSNCSNPDFKEFGLNANSSVLNTSSFFISFILLIILHFLIISLKIFVDKCCSCGFCCCLMTLVKWVLDKCLIIMTYGYYIRFTMEMNQFLLVASIYEIYSLSLSTLFNIISFCCAFLVLFFCLLFTYIVLYLSFSSYEISDDKQNKMGEFFLGIKMDKKYKFFASALILRRTLFVILLITLMSISSKLLILIFGIDALKVFVIKLKECFFKPTASQQSSVIQLSPEFLSRIGAPSLKRIVPSTNNVSQIETNINRNTRYN